MPFDGIELPHVTEDLIAARRRLDRGWCQHRSYRRHWTWRGRRAEFCLGGAVTIGVGTHYRERHFALLDLAIIDLGYDRWSISDFNDHHSKAEVLAVVDRAIAISRGL